MGATLHGKEGLARRLAAIATVGDAIPRRWQEATVRAARQMVPVGPTGETRRSLRPGRATGKNVTVVGKYTVNFIDAGSKAHVEPRQRGLTKTGRVSRRKLGSGKVLKFEVGGLPVFRKKVNKPAIAARPFKKESGRRGLEAIHMDEITIGLWNKAD